MPRKMTPIDCKLTVSDSGKVNYAADYAEAKEGNPGTDPLTHLALARINFWIDKYEGDCRVDDLKVLGLLLYGVLFDDNKIRDAFKATYETFERKYAEAKKEAQDEGQGEPTLRLRVQLVFTKNAPYAKLPWEFLFVPFPDVDRGFFLAGERTELILTRFVEPALVKNLTRQKPPLKIMIAYCHPKDQKIVDPERVDQMIKLIEELGKPSSLATNKPPRVTVKMVDNPTFDELRTAIENKETGLPHIVHFIGHGRPGALAFVKDPAKDADPNAALMPPRSQTEWIPSDQLRGLFANHKPLLVFLQACQSSSAIDTKSSLESLKTTALDLVYAEVPAVIAMQYKISNDDAGIFAKKFYEQIGKGTDIEEAVKLGRIELGQLNPAWASRRFGTPVVYLQTKGAIIDLAEEEGEGEQSAKICVKCQKPIAANSMFCNMCGTQVSVVSTPSGAPAPSPPSATPGATAGPATPSAPTRDFVSSASGN